MKMDLKTQITGHVVIREQHSGKILFDGFNAIHAENMSYAIARALSGDAQGHIMEMHFGNGGATVNTNGSITYLEPNVEGYSADLYNPTYSKIVDENSSNNSDTIANNLVARHTVGTIFSDIVIKCTLNNAEPSGQQSFDDIENIESDFVFDEIGLKSFSPIANQKLLLSHVIFNPIAKSLNRSIEVIYTIRIQLC